MNKSCESLRNIIPSDVIGVIASFLPPTTCHQQRLMLVNNTWYQGVVQQDGMKPKPNINWPLDAMKQRQPQKLKLCWKADITTALSALVAIDQECGPFVESLNLKSHDSAFTIEIMKSLTEFKFLTELQFDEPEFNDGAFELLLCHVGPQLERLSFDGCECEPVNITLICHNCPHLTHFYSPCCQEISDDELMFMSSSLLYLETLHCDLSSLSSTGMLHLCRFKSLKALTLLSGTHTSDTLMQHVADMKNLTQLTVSGECDATDSSMMRLASKEGSPITTLSLNQIQCEKFTEDCLQHFVSLTSFSLTQSSHWQCSPQLGLSLAKLTQLKVLCLSDNNQLQHGCLKGIGALIQLEEVDACLCVSLGDRDAEHLSHCTNITSLDMSWWGNLTDAGMKHVAKLQKLNTLSAGWTQVTCQGLQHVSSLKHLRTQRLFKVTAIDDKCCQTLFKDGSMFMSSRALRLLDISGCVSVTNVGLCQLGVCLPFLQHLDLSHTRVSDTGVAILVEQLKGLERLFLHNCEKVTRLGAEKVQTQRRSIGDDLFSLVGF